MLPFTILHNQKKYVCTRMYACMYEGIDEKLLSVTIDKDLSFKTHLNSLCKEPSQKLHAMTWISN